MIEHWNSFSGNAKFSIIAFIVTLIFGFISIGLLGGLLYYPVSPLFKKYGTLNLWRGDWVWPACIGAGMLWSFGFLIAGYTFSIIKDKINSMFLMYLVYVIILWLWAAIIWYFIIRTNIITTSR
jgi:hypothetical protein